MQNRHKIHIALPHHEDIHSVLENALKDNFNLTDKIDHAQIVVTDSHTHKTKNNCLPKSVRLLQLIDCGSGAPNITDENLTIANTSSLLVNEPAKWAIDQWHEITRQSNANHPNIAGIIGFGSLGYELGKRLNKLGAKIWVNDIRTPKQMSFQSVGARRSSRDMLMSRSDIIFIAVHHGPTSDPLLTTRDLRLLDSGATIINLSDQKVVDHQAIKTLNTRHERNLHYRQMPPNLPPKLPSDLPPNLPPNLPPDLPSDLPNTSPSRQPQTIAHWISQNLTHYATNHQPHSIVEHVTHPHAGDPAFWSSKMHPRQTPT